MRRLDLHRIRMVLSHGGPGPHKDGSPQSVHGGGRGSKSASTSTTGKAGGKNYPVRESSFIKWGVAGDPNNFNIYNGGGRATGILASDFPNDRTSPTRGEIWYIEVPKGSRRQGQGYALAKDVLNVMRSKGMKTVNMDGVSKEGRGLISKLQNEGDIGELIRQSKTGKAEYVLNYPQT